MIDKYNPRTYLDTCRQEARDVATRLGDGWTADESASVSGPGGAKIFLIRGVAIGPDGRRATLPEEADVEAIVAIVRELCREPGRCDVCGSPVGVDHDSNCLEVTE